MMIPTPEYVSFIDFANSLIIDFPHENIPILSVETEWKQWGDFVSQLNSFSKLNAPGTSAFEDKWTWAKELYYVMSPTYS